MMRQTKRNRNQPRAARVVVTPPVAAAAAVALAAAAVSCRSAGPATRVALTPVRMTPACAVAAQPAAGTGYIGAADPSDPSDPRVAAREICEMMNRSARDWNRGDLDAFMADYVPGDATTYVTPREVLHGTDVIRRVYAPRFAPGGVRDSLSFEDLEVDVLAPNVANVIAYYVLSRGDSTVARGPTSLVMRRAGGRWRIVHDHSS